MGIAVVKVRKKTKEEKIAEALDKAEKRHEKKLRTRQSDGHRKKEAEQVVDERKFKRKRVKPDKKKEGVDFKQKKIPLTKRDRDRLKDLRQRVIDNRKVQT